MTDHLVHSRFAEGSRSYEAAQTPEDYQHALDIFSELLKDSSALPDDIRRSSVLLSAECMIALERHDFAEPLLRELLREIGPESDNCRDLVARARLSLAQVLHAAGAWQEAIDLLLATVTYFQQEGDWLSEANVYHSVAQLWQDLSQPGRAEASLDAAWTILEQHEPTPLHLQVLFVRGHRHYLDGDIELAVELEERALAVARRIGDTQAEAQLVSNLAEFTFSIQDIQRAIHYNARKLRKAQTDNDLVETARCLSVLGVCYVDTGRPHKAIEALDEAQNLLSTHGHEESPEFRMCLLGKAKALINIKRYDEAKPILAKLRGYLARPGADTEPLDKCEQQLKRETRSPLIIDCAHGVLQTVLTGSSRGTSHHNLQPAINLTQLRNYTPDLTDDDRTYFVRLHEKLSDDLLKTQYWDSRSQHMPGEFYLPLWIEYVDDVESFEIKWAAFKRELRYAERCAEMQEEWEQIRTKVSRFQGVFHGDIAELVAYVSQLSYIAELCAELGNRELFREVALHAADFIEVTTDDPMLATLIWLVRGQLMIAAHMLAQSDCRELVKIELCRSFDRLQEILHSLDKERREVALASIVGLWFRGANSILGREGYASLVEIVGDLADSLDLSDRIRHGIAVSEACTPAEGICLVDSVLAQIRAENPNTPIYLGPEIETALAVNRFKALAPNFDACLRQYGPFAPYIHDEVRGWREDIYQVSGQRQPLPQPRPLAFADDNLIVIDKQLSDTDHGAAIWHELSHLLRRAHQQLLTEDGRWVLVKRDVPVASSLTYFLILQSEARGGLVQIISQIQDLVHTGRRLAEEEPVQSATYINNMLRYFDDLGMQETRASYPCAAVLLGMAFGYLSDPEAVRSYLKHLEVMDHDEALAHGRMKATLRI